MEITFALPFPGTLPAAMHSGITFCRRREPHETGIQIYVTGIPSCAFLANFSNGWVRIYKFLFMIPSSVEFGL